MRGVNIDPDREKGLAEKMLRELKSGNCPVHSECALIEYMETSTEGGWDKIPPFNYIGVSKLSCGACRTWIQTFNQQGGKKFYTRGSHGRWYWPWGMPTVGGPLGEQIVEKIWSIFHGYELEMALTESTTAASVDVSEEEQSSGYITETESESHTSDFTPNESGYKYGILDLVCSVAENLMILIRPGPLKDF